MLARGQKWLAVFMIILGALSFYSLTTGRDGGALFWPLVFIFAGAMLIMRPPSFFPESLRVRFANEVAEHGEWQVRSQNYLAFANEVNLDLRAAHIPPGETLIALSGFASDLTLVLPPQVGVAVRSHAFATDATLFGEKRDYVFSGIDYTSEGYQDAEKRLRFEINSFAVELKVIR